MWNLHVARLKERVAGAVSGPEERGRHRKEEARERVGGGRDKAVKKERWAWEIVLHVERMCGIESSSESQKGHLETA